MSTRIESEKNKYNKIYTDLVFASDDLKQMLDEEELKKRSFLSKVDILKDYMNFLDKLEKEDQQKKGLFAKLFSKNEDIESKLDSYLTRGKITNLDKLSKCSLCKCRNCISTCPMNQCYNCREKEYVLDCNKADSTLTSNSETVTLYNGNDKIVFDVKGYLIEKDAEDNYIRYVYLIDQNDYDNQHILRYSKFKGEESYDSVITDDTQYELVRINNKFIEMGLRV
ncbi:MAG: hypothetical protein ACRCXA_03685 [Peptostreptococcaceae bacterium]